MIPRSRSRSIARFARTAAAFAAPLLQAACAIVPPDGPGPTRDPGFDPVLTAPSEMGPLDLRETDRAVVTTASGERLLRVRFSYLAYEGWIASDDTHRATGTVWFPVDGRGAADPSPWGPVALTEYPPGTSRTQFAFHAEYGERMAAELGIAAAVVDVRGPIARDLRFFGNPLGRADDTFRSEEQFALSMLAEWQKAGDAELLEAPGPGAHVLRRLIEMC